jgi:hypothetical protein
MTLGKGTNDPFSTKVLSKRRDQVRPVLSAQYTCTLTLPGPMCFMQRHPKTKAPEPPIPKPGGPKPLSTARQASLPAPLAAKKKVRANIYIYIGQCSVWRMCVVSAFHLCLNARRRGMRPFLIHALAASHPAD